VAEAQRGILFVLSAPSGTGKSSLARRLIAADPQLRFSISYTTRVRREGEREGQDYHFVEEGSFDRMVADEGFLEWATVHGRRYGTGLSATEKILSAGHDVLLDIDVQGGKQVRARQRSAVLIFVLPPNYAALEKRLRSRRTEGEQDLSLRLAVSLAEAREYRDYDYVVINDDLDRAAGELGSIVAAERARTARRAAEAERIMETFPRG
jgi:guanylate kinase